MRKKILFLLILFTVIQFIYPARKVFCEDVNLYPFILDGRWGYMNNQGEVVLKPQFEGAGYFSDGLAAVSISGKWGYIIESGTVAIEPQFDSVTEFSDSLAAVKSGEKWGYIDESGKYIIEPKFDSGFPFSEKLASVEVNGKFGFISPDGNFAIEPKFNSAGSFSDGLAPACLPEDSIGYIDKTGKFVIEPQFYKAMNFSEGLAAVWIEGPLFGPLRLAYINTSGEVVFYPEDVNPDYNFKDPVEQMLGASFSEGLAAVWIAKYQTLPGIDYSFFAGAMWGYMDKKGKIVIKPQFAFAEPFRNGLAEVQIGIAGTQVTAAYDEQGKKIDLGDQGADPAQRGYIDKQGNFIQANLE